MYISYIYNILYIIYIILYIYIHIMLCGYVICVPALIEKQRYIPTTSNVARGPRGWGDPWRLPRVSVGHSQLTGGIMW